MRKTKLITSALVILAGFLQMHAQSAIVAVAKPFGERASIVLDSQ